MTPRTPGAGMQEPGAIVVVDNSQARTRSSRPSWSPKSARTVTRLLIGARRRNDFPIPACTTSCRRPRGELSPRHMLGAFPCARRHPSYRHIG